jgi:hypothetical protein
MKLQSENKLPIKKAARNKKIDNVVIGLLLSIDELGQPLVAYPGNPDETARIARSSTQLTTKDVGCEVALLFEGGDPKLPLVIGKIQQARKSTSDQDQDESANRAELDGESIVLSARQNITLKCGKASITLTKAGKVVIRGAYLLNRSSGVNRIKGGSVQIN